MFIWSGDKCAKLGPVDFSGEPIMFSEAQDHKSLENAPDRAKAGLFDIPSNTVGHFTTSNPWFAAYAHGPSRLVVDKRPVGGSFSRSKLGGGRATQTQVLQRICFATSEPVSLLSLETD
jgi:hypothetical protein